MDKTDIYMFNEELYSLFKDEFTAYYQSLAAKLMADCGETNKIQKPFTVYLEKQEDGTWLISNL